MFANLSLKNKFLALEAVSFTMLMTTVVFGLLVLHVARDDEIESIQRLKTDIQVMGDIDTMNIVVLREAKTAKDVWIRGTNEENIEKYKKEFVENVARFHTAHESALKGLKQLAEGHQDFDGFIQQMGKLNEEHVSMTGKYLAQIEAHRGDPRESDSKVAGIDREMSAQINELRERFVKFVDEKGAEKVALAEDNFTSHRNMVVIWVILALALSFVIATLIIRQIMRQLGGDPREVVAVVGAMAAGDFSQPPRQAPVAGSLLANVYHMQERLRGMIATVKNQAGQVGDMAHSLAESANRIAQNAQHASDAAASIAVAIEQFNVSTAHISEQGAGAKRIANDSRSNTERGAQVVNKTVSGLLATAEEIQGASGEVSRLGEDASRISDVVKVIKEIADQTNLLALNAAIEAARAGEQGRGFAVVADEVRKLAERTAGATSEINQMSGKIGEVAGHALSGMDKVVKTTQQGVGDAETAQTSIREIQQSFSQVAAVIDEIAGALDQQNAAASGLSRNTEQARRMAGDNLAAAQSLLTLANDLEDRAGEVRHAVEVFRV